MQPDELSEAERTFTVDVDLPPNTYFSSLEYVQTDMNSLLEEGHEYRATFLWVQPDDPLNARRYCGLGGTPQVAMRRACLRLVMEQANSA